MSTPKRPYFKMEGQGLRRNNTYNFLADLEETYTLGISASAPSKSSFMNGSSPTTSRPHGHQHNDYCLVHMDSCLVPAEVAKFREVPSRKKNLQTDKDLLVSCSGLNNYPVGLVSDDRLVSHINHSIVSVLRVGAEGNGPKGCTVQTVTVTNRCAAHCLCLVDTETKSQADIQLVLGFVTGDILVFSCATESSLSRVNSSKVKNGSYYGAVSAMSSCKFGKQLKRSVATDVFNHAVAATSGSKAPTTASSNKAGLLPEDHFPSELVVVGFKSGAIQLLSLDVNGAVVVRTSSKILNSAPNAKTMKSIPGRTASIKSISVSPYTTADYTYDLIGSTGARRGPIAALTTSEGRLLVFTVFTLTPLWEVNHRVDSYGSLLCVAWGPCGMLFAGGEDDLVHSFILEDEAAALPPPTHGGTLSGAPTNGTTKPFFGGDSDPTGNTTLELPPQQHEETGDSDMLLFGSVVQPTWLRPIGPLELHQSWVSSVSVLPMPKSYAGGAFYNDFVLISASHDNSLGLWYFEDERPPLPSGAMNTLKRKGTLSRLSRQPSSTLFRHRPGDVSTNTSIASSTGMSGLFGTLGGGKSSGPAPLPFTQPLECTLNLLKCHREDVCSVVHCVPASLALSIQATTAANAKTTRLSKQRSSSVSPIPGLGINEGASTVPLMDVRGSISPGAVAGTSLLNQPLQDEGLVDGGNEYLMITACIGALAKVWRTTTTMSEPLKDAAADSSFQTPPRFISRSGGTGTLVAKDEEIETPNSTSPVSLNDHHIYSPPGGGDDSFAAPSPGAPGAAEVPIEPSPAKTKMEVN